jgi:hypothetical protein
MNSKLCDFVEVDLETRELSPRSGIWRCPACGLVIRNETKPIARCGPAVMLVRQKRREMIQRTQKPCNCGSFNGASSESLSSSGTTSSESF